MAKKKITFATVRRLLEETTPEEQEAALADAKRRIAGVPFKADPEEARVAAPPNPTQTRFDAIDYQLQNMRRDIAMILRIIDRETFAAHVRHAMKPTPLETLGAHYYNAIPNAENRVDELHAWVATHAHGGETLMTADLPLDDGNIRHVPMISESVAVAETLFLSAREFKRASESGPMPIERVELRTFRMRPKRRKGASE